MLFDLDPLTPVGEVRARWPGPELVLDVALGLERAEADANRRTVRQHGPQGRQPHGRGTLRRRRIEQCEREPLRERAAAAPPLLASNANSHISLIVHSLSPRQPPG